MAGVNDFLAFGTGVGANVLPQASYAALAARAAGFNAGTAQSVQLNKVWRQASAVAAAMGQIVVTRRPDLDALDNGDITTLATNLLAAFSHDCTLTGNPVAPTHASTENSTKIATTAYVKNNLASYYTAVQVAGNFATIAQVNQAQATANTANQVASNALNAANTAQSSANNAQNSANTALITAIGSNVLFPYGYVERTGAKFFNTAYTNSGSRPMQVNVTFQSTNGTRGVIAYVNGVPACANVAVANSSQAFLTFIVPAGQVYQVGSGASNVAIVQWYEFL